MLITQKKLTVYWDNITQDSWNAGTRKVNCNLAALLPDRSGFAPVSGLGQGRCRGRQHARPARDRTPPAPAHPPRAPPIRPPTATTRPRPDRPPRAPATSTDRDRPAVDETPTLAVLPPAGEPAPSVGHSAAHP